MSGFNARYSTLSRLSDGVVLASHKQGQKDEECIAVVAKVLGSGNLAPGSQLSVNISQTAGTMHIAVARVGQVESVFTVVTAPGYPRRAAFQYLEEFRNFVSEFHEAAIPDAKEGEMKPACKRWMQETLLRYDNLASVDRISRVKGEVEEVKIVMEGNISKILENTESLDTIENKTEVLKEGAARFQRSANDLHRIIWWRNLKLKLIIGLIVLCVLGYILIPILSQVDWDGGNEPGQNQDPQAANNNAPSPTPVAATHMRGARRAAH